MSSQKKKRFEKGLPNQGVPSSMRSPVSTSQGLSFSFKYFQGEHQKFSALNRDSSYWSTLLNRLRDLSTLTVQELRQGQNKTLRCHAIDWRDTTENSFGLLHEEQLVDVPYQFSLSSNQHGRVHGFFIGDIFYIVWLDPEHLLYSGR